MTKRIAGWILVLMLVFQAGLAFRSEAEGVDLNPAEGEELMIGLNRDEETARSLLDQFDKNLIDANTFLAAFRDLNVIFSTPYGETKDGQARGYYFPVGDGTAFFPVFTSAERARAYYDAGDRNGYLLMIASGLSGPWHITRSAITTGMVPGTGSAFPWTASGICRPFPRKTRTKTGKRSAA